MFPVTPATKEKTDLSSLAAFCLPETRVWGFPPSNRTGISDSPWITSTLRWGYEQAYDGTVSGRVVGLDYAKNRYYSSILGRFLTPDPSTSNALTDPGQWNKYSYAANDPVNFNDPQGLMACAVQGIPCDVYANYLSLLLGLYPGGAGVGGPWAGLGTAALQAALARAQQLISNAFSQQAADAIKNLSQGCQSALGQKWNLYNGNSSLIYKVNPSNPNADVFFDGTISSVANEPLSYWGIPNSMSTGSFFTSTGTPLFVGENSGVPNNQIILGPVFLSQNTAIQSILLVHDVLHTYTGLNDIQLATKLGLPASLLTNTNDASEAISTYLNVGCDMSKLKQAYGIN